MPAFRPETDPDQWGAHPGNAALATAPPCHKHGELKADDRMEPCLACGCPHLPYGKDFPRCPACGAEHGTCPTCGSDTVGDAPHCPEAAAQ